MVLPFIFGIILSLAHYFSEKIHLSYIKDRMKNISFAAGIFIAYLFLDLFPLLFQGDIYFTKISLVFLLIGFSLFHVIQKYEYKHASRKKLRREIKELHSVALFLYYFVVGIILVNITQASPIRGFLFLIPVFLFTIISSISLKEIHHTIKEREVNKIFLSSSPFLGVILATYIPIAGILYSSLLGLITGSLLFIVMEEGIPKERKGEPLYFIYGIILYTLVIALTWSV